MTASARVEIKFILNDLGNRVEADLASNITTTPTVYNQQRRVLATADTAEALGLGDVSSSQLLVIKAVLLNLEVDLDFVTTFNADLTIPAGETAIIPRPAGVVYVKNATATQTPTYEYYLVGTS